MGSGKPAPLRSLPRAFLPGIPEDLPGKILLPDEEYAKFYKVLRLSSGSEVAIVSGDGRVLRCVLEGHNAVPVEATCPLTEAETNLVLCLSISKNDTLDESVRLATEIGVRSIVLFSSDRTVVKWDDSKREHRLRRMRAIVREAAEVSFRTHLPSISIRPQLREVLDEFSQAQVLSELEGVARTVEKNKDMALVIGPEGGWSPREVELIGERAVTLGPRVLRVDTAVAAACSLALLDRR